MNMCSAFSSFLLFISSYPNFKVKFHRFIYNNCVNLTSGALKKFRHSRGSLRSNADVKKRYQIFAKNMQTIKSHNKAHSSFRMAVNDFADKVREKFIVI